MTTAEPPGPETPDASPEPGAPALRRDRRAEELPPLPAGAPEPGPAPALPPLAAPALPPVEGPPPVAPSVDGGIPVDAVPMWTGDAPPPEAVWAEAPPPPRRRRRTWVWVTIAAVLVVALGAAGLVAWSYQQEQDRLALARQVSSVEQGVVADAIAGSAEVVTQFEQRREEFRTADRLWAESVAAGETFHTQNEAPVARAANPGGDAMPGGNDAARALLDSIGASDVQILFDAGADNCGYTGAAEPGMLAIGGCYNSQYRNWLFLAWDDGVADDDVWPIFVHEAMHWYQWDRYVQLFESAGRAGVSDDQYRDFIESDASCRAVEQHGVPRSAFEGSSAPCNVDGWSDTWLVDRLVELGVPVQAPDPETYEVQEVARP